MGILSWIIKENRQLAIANLILATIHFYLQYLSHFCIGRVERRETHKIQIYLSLSAFICVYLRLSTFNSGELPGIGKIS